MLSDLKLKSLKAGEKAYKVADRDGMYVTVLTSGVISFRYDYRINSRRETFTIGKYGADGISLAVAREKLIEARKKVAAGISPAKEKAAKIVKTKQARTFDTWAMEWLDKYKMAESTRDMRRAVYLREIKPVFGRMLLEEIGEGEIRTLCERIVERGAPATAVHVREVIMLVFDWAKLKGEKIANPADEVRPCSIATFSPRERCMSPKEIAIMYQYLEKVGTTPSIRAAIKLVLLTMVRKGELIKAEWDEVNFVDATWTIPKERMKKRKPHVVYLSQQALDILIAMKTFAGGSRYICPGRYDPDLHMSMATLNVVTTAAFQRAAKDGALLEAFTVHDLRRTASTLLHEAGYNTDWIEKCLAHEQRGVRAVYNKAEYADQRRQMLQDWANMIDGWVAGAKVIPIGRAA